MSHVIISGPGGMGRQIKSPGQIRSQLNRQWSKVDQALANAIEAGTFASGMEGKKITLERTASNLDYKRDSFLSYSESYAKWKGTGRTSVDLRLTGEMLDSIKFRKQGSGVASNVVVEVTGSDSIRKAKALAAGGKAKNKPRRFMGHVVQSELQEIGLKAWRAYQRVMRQMLKYKPR